MNINKVSGLENNLTLKAKQGIAENTADTFSKMLDNLKNGRAADYDKDVVEAEGTTTMTQILSDGSTLTTVTDATGKVIYQSKTRAANPDPNAHVIGSTVEVRDNIADTGAALLNMLGQNG